jgi:hypothetical protein
MGEDLFWNNLKLCHELTIHARKIARLSGDDWRKVENVLYKDAPLTKTFKSKDLYDCLELYLELKESQRWLEPR